MTAGKRKHSIGRDGRGRVCNGVKLRDRGEKKTYVGRGGKWEKREKTCVGGEGMRTCLGGVGNKIYVGARRWKKDMCGKSGKRTCV